MKVSNHNQNINFTSTPLHSIKIQKLMNGADFCHENAVISKLNPDNIEDVSAILNIRENWENFSGLVKLYCSNFLTNRGNKNLEHYAIELPNMHTGENEIMGVVTSHPLSFPHDRKIYLSYILTNPRHVAQKPDRKVKGVGEILMSKVFHRAKETNATNLEINSSNNGFYFKTFNNAGIEVFEAESGIFDIPKQHFNKYIEYCEKKYGFKFPAIKTEG